LPAERADVKGSETVCRARVLERQVRISYWIRLEIFCGFYFAGGQHLV